MGDGKGIMIFFGLGRLVVAGVMASSRGGDIWTKVRFYVLPHALPGHSKPEG